MSEKRAARRPGELDGVRVILSDDGVWALPVRDPACLDPEHDALLRAVEQAEDRAEMLRAELALTIFLLSRQNDLAPEDLGALLSFEPDDPRLGALQSAVHGLALESLSRVYAARGAEPWPQQAPEPMKPAPGDARRRWGLRFWGFRPS